MVFVVIVCINTRNNLKKTQKCGESQIYALGKGPINFTKKHKIHTGSHCRPLRCPTLAIVLVAALPNGKQHAAPLSRTRSIPPKKAVFVCK